MIEEIFRGLHNPDFVEKVLEHMKEDDHGLPNYSVALFGEPGSGAFEFVFTGRHCTAPVSYTHLDVYKRQCHYQPGEGHAHSANSPCRRRAQPGNSRGFITAASPIASGPRQREPDKACGVPAPRTFRTLPGRWETVATE